MNKKQRKILEDIVKKPVKYNVKWSDIVSQQFHFKKGRVK